MKKVTAFQCEYCRRKVMMNKTHLAEHEFICFHNPRRKACQTCGNYAEDYETVYDNHHGGDPGSTDYEVLVRYCEAKEKPLDDIPKWETCECKQWKPITPIKQQPI